MDHFQQQFHQRWQHLRDMHVRALAWIISSPDLLDRESAVWKHQIGRLDVDQQIDSWLNNLDANPSAFHSALQLQTHRRLGHYAENLLRFYFAERGELFASNLQVNDVLHRTIGEFDYLLQTTGGLIHWELATKFYLFQKPMDVQSGERSVSSYDYLGPNLADSLGAKMRKILDQQLSLSTHPAVQTILNREIISAQALIKGWLFYRADSAEIDDKTLSMLGINQHHCRGCRWNYAELSAMPFTHAVILPRLLWLAPAQKGFDEVLERSDALRELESIMARDQAPVMVALMQPAGEWLQEWRRGMLVPDDWEMRAKTIQRR